MTIEKLRAFLDVTIREESKLDDIDYYRGRVAALRLILDLISEP